MRDAEWRALVEKCERRARRTPLLYRIEVGGWLALGYLAMGSLLVFGLLILALAAALLMSGKGIWLVLKVGKLLLAIPVLLFSLFKALWVKLEAPQGAPLLPEQYPELFRVIERLRSAARAKRLHQVLLVSDFNAGVAATPILRVLPWYRYTLVVGLPLLMALRPEEAEAVLAHEFGHLSRAHGQWGARIYRMRRAWSQMLEQIDTSRRTPLTRFLRWYLPRFSAVSFALARDAEYEADQMSVALVGATHAAHALIRTELVGQSLDEDFWPRLREEARRTPQPPLDFEQRREQAFAQAVMGDVVEGRLRHALARYTDTADTHPALQDRLAAIGAAPTLPAPVERSAAHLWLGAALPVLLEQSNHAFASDAAESWKAAFETHEQQRAAIAAVPLEELDAAGKQERARLLEEVGEDEAALSIYLDLAAADSDALGAHFGAGRLYLERKDPRCEGFLLHCLNTAPELGGVIHRMLSQLYYARGDRDRANHHVDQAEEHEHQRALAAQERDELTKKDTFERADNDHYAELLRSEAADLPHISRLWLTRKKLRFSPERPLYVVVLQFSDVFAFSRAKRRQDWGARVRALVECLPEGVPETFVCCANLNKWVVKKVSKIPGSRLM